MEEGRWRLLRRGAVIPAGVEVTDDLACWPLPAGDGLSSLGAGAVGAVFTWTLQLNLLGWMVLGVFFIWLLAVESAGRRRR